MVAGADRGGNVSGHRPRRDQITDLLCHRGLTGDVIRRNLVGPFRYFVVEAVRRQHVGVGLDGDRKAGRDGSARGY